MSNADGIQGGEVSALTDDNALVARLALGEEDALRVLHGRYAPLVFTVAARIADEAAAEDVVQDVFLTLWKKHATFDPARGTFKAWLTQIARRCALNELRRRRGRGEEADNASERIADDGVLADDALWEAHRRAKLRTAVDALPPAQRQALSLAFFDELTHEQVAAVLHAPIGTAKTRIRLAMKRLAPLLATLMTVVVLLVVWRRDEQNAALNDRALRMVTSSDVVPRRLEASVGVPTLAHGNYRARPGVGVAVLTTSSLPVLGPTAGRERYFAWARHGATWVSLGRIRPGADGRSLLVHEDASLASPVDEVRVTREITDRDAPHGPIVIAWPTVR